MAGRAAVVCGVLSGLAVSLIAPSTALAFRQALDAEVMSVWCDDYLDTTDGPASWSGSHVGVDCTMRVFVGFEGEPHLGLTTTDFSINHLHSRECGDTIGGAATVTDEGAGVYSVSFACEPDDVSVQVSDSAPSVDAGAVVVWGRSDYLQRAGMRGLAGVGDLDDLAASVARTEVLAEQSLELDSFVYEILRYVVDPKLDSVGNSVTTIHGNVNSISGVVGGIDDVVDDICSFLGC